MTSYTTGLVTVTNGSDTVAGASTFWQNAIIEGDLFALSLEGPFYEVTVVNDDSSITLDRNYAASTAAAQSYVILRLSLTRQSTIYLANRVQSLLDTYSGILSVSGDDKTVTLDKSAVANNAMSVLKTNGAERWRSGTIGDDNWRLQRSADGLAYGDALVVNRDTGEITVSEKIFGSRAQFTHSTSYGFNVTATDSDPDATFYAANIDYNVSGDSALTGDRSHVALRLDVDSTSTGGDIDDEHRVYGLISDLDVFGDSDAAYSIQATVSAAHSAGQITNLRAIVGDARTDNSGGSVSGLYGGYFSTVANPSGLGTVSTGYGVYSRFLNQAGTTPNARGVYSEVEIDGGVISTAVAYSAHIDLDGGSITNAYVLNGGYATTSNITNAWGVYVAGSTKNYLAGTLQVSGIYNNTTASSANVYVDSGGNLKRSTSTMALKSEVSGAAADKMLAFVMAARPFSYKSLASGDDPAFIHWGLAAEELALLDPAFVHWKTHKTEAKKRLVISEDGTEVEEDYLETTALESPVADGIQYERLTVPLIAVAQHHQRAIETLSSAVGAIVDPLGEEVSATHIAVERDRRLAEGFDFDFGDDRGVHRIGTTARDRKGWDEVSAGAQAAIALGVSDQIFDIVTDTGPVQVTALEWMQILAAATAHRQPIWQSFFALQGQSEYPDDYTAESYWLN
ncbi:MAG: hypothetical protein K5905_12030 [Roseibium sp.]|uniref:hypothetical protein n=1 Tax=Roseibium sp. TaxID=1936156 RepID=UPI002636E630|nr:hypothetical protein [Roseibium sp.]MCV0426195.1 hypothetical protein [Roseibium sp.]